MKSRTRKKLSKKLTIILKGFTQVDGWWIDRRPEYGAKMMPRVGGHYNPELGDCDDSIPVYSHVRAQLIHIMRDGEDQQGYPILKKRMTGQRVIEAARKAAKLTNPDKMKTNDLHKILAMADSSARKNYRW